MFQPFLFSTGETISLRWSMVRLYFVAASILIIVGSTVIYYSFSTSVTSPNSSPGSDYSAPVSLKSPQWSGYVVMSNLLLRQPEVTIITGSWTIPSIEPTANDMYSSVWIGVGGFGEKSLIQTGTAQQSVKGIVGYYAWYELLPNRAVRVQNFSVSPGDRITATVKLVDSSKDIWSVEISDLTRDTSFSKNFVYKSSRLSAEWIVEAPSISGEITTLANFGNITFTGCFATIADTTGSISSFPGNQLIMYDNQDVQLVDVSPLTEDGSVFTVTYSKAS